MSFDALARPRSAMWVRGQSFVVALRLLATSLAMFLNAGCDDPATPRPLYDAATNELVRLDVDVNGDGLVDMRTYARGSRVMRSELDLDGDSHIDRWEYLGPGNQLAMIGTASVPGGVEDTWTFAEIGGETRVDRLNPGDRFATRHEYYRANMLVRAEEDTNFDGVVDKWEAYDAGHLRWVAFDTSHASGRPDRRLHYDEQGQFTHLELLRGGDGARERVKP